MPRRASPLSATAIVASMRSLVTQLHKQRAVLSATMSRTQRELAEVDQAIKLFGKGVPKPAKAKKPATRKRAKKPGKPTQPLVLAILGRKGTHTLDTLVKATKLTRQQTYNAVFNLVTAKKVKRDGDNLALA